MNDSFDREKVIDCMFDPITSLIIAELENGQKSSQYLADKSNLSENEVGERLSYLISHNFIFENKHQNLTPFTLKASDLTPFKVKN